LIFLISSEFPPGPGGIGQHAYSLSMALSNQHQVVVLTNQDYATNEEIALFLAQLPHNIQVIRFAKRYGKLTSFRRTWQTLRLVKQLNPEVIFTSGRFALWLGAIIKKVMSKRTVYGFAHGIEVHPNSGILGVITRKACGILNGIMAVSEFTASLLQKQSLQKIEILPNGLDETFIKQSRMMASTINPFNWHGHPKLLTVGNVTPRKGQHRVIKALPEILKHFPNAHYHVVGLPTNADRLLELAKTLGVYHAVTFHGKLSSRQDLYRAYLSADIFIMLSENQANGDVEGFGIAILEANAFGVPSIGAIGCGIEDAISSGSGILVDGNNAISIVAAIQKILTEKENYARNARLWAEKHNWAELIKKVWM